MPGVLFMSGSLGNGLAAGVGMALSGRLHRQDYMTYVLIGDGEMQEGMVWEAAMAAAAHRVDNLVAIIDYNKVQATDTTEKVLENGMLKQKWEAFGWNAIEIDGHDFNQILDALDQAAACKGKPTAIIAHTVKGKGFSFAEGKAAYHNAAMNEEEYAIAQQMVKKMKEEA